MDWSHLALELLSKIHYCN